MRFLNYLGRAKYKLIRVIAYVQLVNLALLIQLNGFHLWYVFLIPVFLLVYWFELKFGIPGETEVSWKSCKEWQDFKEDFYTLAEYLYKK